MYVTDNANLSVTLEKLVFMRSFRAFLEVCVTDKKKIICNKKNQYLCGFEGCFLVFVTDVTDFFKERRIEKNIYIDFSKNIYIFFFKI